MKALVKHLRSYQLFLITDFATFASLLRKSRNISFRAVHTIFGVLLALFVLTHAVTVTHLSTDDKQEQDDSKESDKQQITESIAIILFLLVISR
ncbi:MAG: hypothetical protein AAFY41_03070 [Bacteroidota bacterium]